MLLQQAGAILTTAATGVGVMATIAAFFVTPLAPIALLATGIGLAAAKAGVKVVAEGKKSGGKEAAASGASAGVEAGLEVVSEAAAGGVGGAGVLLGAKGLGDEVQAISKLKAEQVAAKAALVKILNGMQILEEEIGSKAFQNSLKEFDGEINAKLAAALTNIKAIKAKISDVDKSIDLGTAEVIKREHVNL